METMNSKRFLDIVSRSETGEKVSSDDWNMQYIMRGIRKIVKSHDLKWDKQVIIPEDDALLDELMAAAKELILQTGIYNITKERIIPFTEEEIEEGLKNMRQELTMGEGDDAYTLVARKIEDSRPPAVWAGSPGCPTPENIFYENVLSTAKEPVIDLMTCGSMIDVDGHQVKNGEATEVLAVRREMQYLRKALEEAGRPGMGLLAAESAVTSVGDLSAVAPGMLRSTDSHLIVFLNELIIDTDNLCRVANSFDTDIKNASLACTMVGGLAGDAPGGCISMMASIMAANVLGNADDHLCHPIHIKDIATTARGCLWLQSVLCQSFAKNYPAIIVCDIWPCSGALTKELLYETAANAIVVTVSGGHLEGVGSANGNEPNGTGLECRLMGEVGKAVAAQGMTRAEANEIVLKLIEKYEHVYNMDDKNKGQRFDVAYDMETITPVPEWQQMYDEVKAELADMGIKW